MVEEPEGQAADLLADAPDGWGPKFAGRGSAVTVTRTGPSEIGFTTPTAMALVMLTPQPDREVALNSGRKARFLAPAGEIEIVPAGSELFARWLAPKQNLLVAIAPERMRLLAETALERPDLKLLPVRPGHIDRQAHLLAVMIREEFRRGSECNELYLESLTTALSIHLLRTFSSGKVKRQRVLRGGLRPEVLNRVNGYIDAGLARKLTIEELARVAGLSPSQFTRAFRETTGQPPHQYLLGVRLARAKRLILGADIPLAAIAAQCGFASQSHLSTTMRRLWSTTPRRLARESGRRS